MDDRLAKLLLEDNILERIERLRADVNLLQKLATNPSVVMEVPEVPGVEPEPSDDPLLNWENKIFLFDEFMGGRDQFLGSGIKYGAGNLNWNTNGDARFGVWQSSAAHPGVLILDLYSGGSGRGYMCLGSFPSTNLFAPMKFSNLEFAQFIVAGGYNNTAGSFVLAGVIDTYNYDSNQLSTQGSFFYALRGDANWKVKSIDGSGSTVTDTGVPYVNSEYVFLEIKNFEDHIEFYINQSLVALHTTHISTTELVSPAFGLTDGVFRGGNMNIDYFAMSFQSIGQRWD